MNGPGRELVEGPRQSPEDAAKAREKAQNEIKRLDKQIKERRSDVAVLKDKRAIALNRFHEFPNPDAGYVTAYDAWRRCEETRCQGLAEFAGRYPLQVGFSVPTGFESWDSR